MSCSSTTYLKQELFLQCFKEFCFQHKGESVHTIDMNGFQGEYFIDGKQILGSSIVMDVMLNRFDCDYSGITYEEKTSNYVKLKEALRKYRVDKIKPTNSDNRGVTNLLLRKDVPTFLYYDPDSPGVPWIRTINTMMNKYPLMDVLVYAGAGSVKRQHAKGNCPSPFDMLAETVTNRKNAYITTSYFSKRQWFLLLVTNNEYKLPDYCNLSSPLGKLLKQQLDKTAAEVKELKESYAIA